MITSDKLILKVYDIETIFEEFSITISDPNYQNPIDFRINRFINQIDALTKYLLETEVDYWVGYNNVTFDSQVLQHIISNKDKWVQKTGAEMAALIWQFAQDVIDDTNAGLFPPYREQWLWAKQMDIFKIHHFDNEARRTSLKWLEYSMDLEDIEEMPIAHANYKWVGNRKVPYDRLWKDEEFSLTDHYRRNDVKATCVALEYTLGNVEHEVYKGKNKIQDRLDTIDEFKLPKEAMNWSDVKIGDELNKLGYMQLKGIKDAKVIYDLKKNRRGKRQFTYGDCIPDYVKFTSPTLIGFYERIKDIRVKLTEKKDKEGKKKKQEFSVAFNKTTYTIARGGIHSNEKNRIIIPLPNEVLMDADVGSQYPNAIFKRKLFPSHLGPEWLIMYGNTIQRRLTFKTKGKTDKRAKGIAEMLKLSLNGGGFGKLNEPSNWQYDPFAAFSCTIGNQFEILMLIEALEIEGGIHVISANTDGIVCLFDKSKLDTYYKICHEWEAKVGNTEMGQLEYTEYTKMVQKSVNDYLAIPKDPEEKIKKKGDFMTEFELNKNRSKRILPLIYENYFVRGIQSEQTIRNHVHLSDFCSGLKASRNYHYEAINTEDSTRIIYNRVVRYYISVQGKLLVKIKNEGSEATGPEISNVEARDYGHWSTTECNNYRTRLAADVSIDYKFYLDKANEFIRSIEANSKKGKKTIFNKDQTSLF